MGREQRIKDAKGRELVHSQAEVDQVLLKYDQTGEPLWGMFEPFYDKVVVGRIEAAENNRYGIIIPGTDKAMREAQVNLLGVVVAHGPGRIIGDTARLQPLQVTLGDQVTFTPIDGRDIFIDGRLYRIMPEDSLIAITNKCHMLFCPNCLDFVSKQRIHLDRNTGRYRHVNVDMAWTDDDMCSTHERSRYYTPAPAITSSSASA